MNHPEFESVARFIQNANPYDGNVMEGAVDEIHTLLDRVAPSAAWNPRACLEVATILCRHRAAFDDAELGEMPRYVSDLVRAAGALVAMGPYAPQVAPAPLPTKPQRIEPVRLTLPESDDDDDSETHENLRENRLRMITELALGEIMVELGMIETEQLLTALEAQRATGLRFGEALVELGSATWPDINRAMEVQDEYRGKAHAE